MSLVLVLFGCKSPEERACAHTVTLLENSQASHYQEDGKDRTKHVRDCVESLRRLRAEIKPNEELWFTYLRCLSDSADMSAQFDCLAPLTKEQMKDIAQAIPKQEP